MRRMLLILAVFGSLCAVGNAGACNDLGFLTQLGNVNKQIVKSTNVAGSGNYRLGRDYVLLGKRMFANMPAPCRAGFKVARAQYSIMLDYYLRGMNQAVSGNLSGAISYIHQGTIWMNKAATSIKTGY